MSGNAPLKKIRVVHVITRWVPGGASKIVRSLIEGLDSTRYEQTLICGLEDIEPGDVWRKELTQEGIRVILLPNFVRSISPLQDLLCLGILIKLFLQLKPHLVHTHTSKASILGRFAAKLVGVPRLIHTPHGHIYLPGAQIEGVPERGIGVRILKAAERWANSWTQAIVTLTDREKAEMKELRLADPDKIETVTNAIDLEKLHAESLPQTEARKKFQIPEKAFVIGTIGRFSRVKGHLEFLKAAKTAFAQDSSLYFVLVGMGPDEGLMRDFVRQEGLQERVSFLGYQERVGEILPAFDLFVLPSLYEGFGISILEAWAFKLPVIATKVGGLIEVIDENQNGILVPAADAEAMAQAMIQVQNKPEKAQQWGCAGYDKLVRCFTVEVMVRHYQAIYDRVLKDLY